MFILLTLTLKSHLDSLFFVFLELLWKTEEPVRFFIYEQIIISLTLTLTLLSEKSISLIVPLWQAQWTSGSTQKDRYKKETSVITGTLVFIPADCFSVPPPPQKKNKKTGSDVHSLSMPSFTDDNTGWPQDEFVSRTSAHLTL